MLSFDGPDNMSYKLKALIELSIQEAFTIVSTSLAS